MISHQSDQKTIRVFFALWPTAAERGQLAAWQNPLQRLCGGRIMLDETLHNTLAFIGDIEQHRLEALHLAALEVGASSFELCFDEARYWGHNHIAYAAPSHTPPQLVQLVFALEQRLTRHHFKLEKREYKPHVTLLRNAHWTDVPLPEMLPVRWCVQDFALMQSVSRNGVACYQVLERFSLITSGSPYGG